MTDQPPILPAASTESGGTFRHPLGGSSLLLMLFVLAALPPASLAQGLQPQAVIELLGTAPESPRRETPRELRAFRGWVSVLATSTRPWIGSPAIGAASGFRRSAFDLRPCECFTLIPRLSVPASQRAHVRAALHDLPPPRC